MAICCLTVLLRFFKRQLSFLAAIWLLDVEVVGSILNVIIVNVVLALVALAFGILLSTLAKSEFQMMQFIPLVIMPQLFSQGLFHCHPWEHGLQLWGNFCH